MLDLIAISNPRTPDGSWVSKSGCSFCGAVSCGYVGISVQLDEDSHLIQICGSCLSNAEKARDEAILKQCDKRVE